MWTVLPTSWKPRSATTPLGWTILKSPLKSVRGLVGRGIKDQVRSAHLAVARAAARGELHRRALAHRGRITDEAGGDRPEDRASDPMGPSGKAGPLEAPQTEFRSKEKRARSGWAPACRTGATALAARNSPSSFRRRSRTAPASGPCAPARTRRRPRPPDSRRRWRGRRAPAGDGRRGEAITGEAFGHFDVDDQPAGKRVGGDDAFRRAGHRGDAAAAPGDRRFSQGFCYRARRPG